MAVVVVVAVAVGSGPSSTARADRATSRNTRSESAAGGHDTRGTGNRSERGETGRQRER